MFTVDASTQDKKVNELTAWNFKNSHTPKDMLLRR